MNELDKHSAAPHVPAVGVLLDHPDATALISHFGRELIRYSIRSVLQDIRLGLSRGQKIPTAQEILDSAAKLARRIDEPSLRPVINATGVILHSNLGRAVLGPAILDDIAPIVCGYSNLEYDTDRASRGRRKDHIAPLLRFLTGAEDIIVVNNNAAALVLILNTLAQRRDVIVSRGELIEIGGSFRLPDIMRASGAKLREVGTTNRTRIGDFEQALSQRTALLLKAHPSNFRVSGFHEDVSIREMAALALRHSIPMVYDIGSGLLCRPEGLELGDEPDVRSALHEGADLVCFSGDKLLGGPQAGIIAGRADLIRRLEKAPLMRALRIDKLTLAALASACRGYRSRERLRERNPTFALLERSIGQLTALADELAAALKAAGLDAVTVDSPGQCGGGTLPDVHLDGKAVALIAPPRSGRTFASTLMHRLLNLPRPIVAVLRQGQLLLDVRAIATQDLPYIAQAVANAVNADAELKS